MRFVPAIVSLLLLSASGCATYSQTMVAPDGTTYRCTATGQGVIGMATASGAKNDCVEGYRAMGCLELERAGFVGLTMNASAVILKVWGGFPAADAGMRAGDRIVAVSGQAVDSDRDAQVLLFGPAGELVSVTAVRDGAETTYKLIRAHLHQEPPRKAHDSRDLDY